MSYKKQKESVSYEVQLRFNEIATRNMHYDIRDKWNNGAPFFIMGKYPTNIYPMYF